MFAIGNHQFKNENQSSIKENTKILDDIEVIKKSDSKFKEDRIKLTILKLQEVTQGWIITDYCTYKKTHKSNGKIKILDLLIYLYGFF